MQNRLPRRESNTKYLNIPGAPRPITDQKRLAELAEELAVYLEDYSTRGPAKLKLVRINSATTQSAGGRKYEIMADIQINGEWSRCKITLWTQPWLKNVKMDVECGDNKYSFEQSTRRKYSYLRTIDGCSEK